MSKSRTVKKKKTSPAKIQMLEILCRHAIVKSGVDVRTSFFASYLLSDSTIQRLQKMTKLTTGQITQILKGFIAHRYADYFERRKKNLVSDVSPLNLILSQGYKRGLKWKGMPLGKTCWDISIYQQLIQDLKPKTIIEIGTGLGASSLFYLDHCRMHGLKTKIVTLDINSNDVNPKIFKEKNIEFIEGDAKNLVKLLPAKRLRQLPHPWLIVEDCHEHVPLIVKHLEPHMESGDYLIIEDMGLSPKGSHEIEKALRGISKGTLMVDTALTDMFGRNLTCSPDSIFRKM